MAPTLLGILATVDEPLAYEVVSYTPDRRDDVLAVQTGLWSQDLALNGAYFDWKYHDNPYLADPCVWLALHEGEVVGSAAVFGLLLECRDEEMTVVCAADAVVRPEHRRRGVFGLLVDAQAASGAAEGWPIVFSFSATPVSARAHSARGWVSGGVRTRWVRPARPRRTMRRLFGRGGLDGHPFDADPGDLRRVAFSNEPAVSSMVEMSAALPSERIRHRRDATYLHWRLANPLSRYAYLLHESGEGCAILAAGRSARIGDPVLLLDLQATGPAVADELRAAACDAVRSDLHAVPTNDDEAAAFARRGFVEAGADPLDFLALATGEGGRTIGRRDPMRLEDWEWRELYSDWS